MGVDENKSLLWGIGMLALGGLITLSSHVGGETGDTYVVATGFLVIGGVSLIRGLYLHLKSGSRA